MPAPNPLDGFEVDRAAIRTVGHDLQRPECILAEPAGTLWAADAYGHPWCTLAMVDERVALTLQGDLRVLLDDGDPDASGSLLAKMAAGAVTADDAARARGTLAPWLAGITFGGADLRAVHVAGHLGTTIPTSRSPVPAPPMVHWHERH